MTSEEQKFIAEITADIAALINGEPPSQHESRTCCQNELVELREKVNNLIDANRAAKNFITALSQGDLEVAPPAHNHMISHFKQLHANLRHLVWQTKQVAAGDLDQHVDYLGEFSVTFKSMIETLREKKHAEESLRFISIHDNLTGIYNRSFFNEELARLQRSRRFPITMMIGDLDGLKTVNDTLGHAAGDLLIQEAAKALLAGVRTEDIVARIGGDEFAIILPGVDSAAAAEVVIRIQECVTAQNDHSSPFNLCISLGVVTVESGGSLEEAMSLADKRMYEEKFAKKQR